jgi:hypothetical protein
MPPLTRWYIRLAFAYLVVALLAGTAAVARQPLGLPVAIAVLGPVAVHLFVVGWVTQMIFGVAYWMFPRRSAEMPRGDPAPALATLALINAGLVLRLIAEPWQAVRPSGTAAALLIASAAAQWLAGVAFVWQMWPRIKER